MHTEGDVVKLPSAKQRGRYAAMRKKGMPKAAARRVARSRNRPSRKRGRGRGRGGRRGG